MATIKRILIVDDDDTLRGSLAEQLVQHEGFAVDQAADGRTALELAEEHTFDVILLDLGLPRMSGIDVTREVKARHPFVEILIFTIFDEEDKVLEAVKAGASGYLLKQILGQDLVAAVRTVAAGGSLLDPTATTTVLDRLRRSAEPAGPLAKLSDQERTVLELIGEGLTNRQIGARMGLAEKTVKNYTSHLLAKLGLERRTQAAILATRLRDRPPT